MSSSAGLGRPEETPPRLDSARTRILTAMAEVVAGCGFVGSTVGLVCARAGVAEEEFGEQFCDLEDCLVAVLDGVLERVSVLAWRALECEEDWQDGVRGALAAVLQFFDSEPELARVCIVEALASGPRVLAQRERIVGAFRALVAGRIEGEVSPVSPLASEGVMATVLGIVHAHIVNAEPEPLIALLGPLMGLVVAPYLGGRESEREVRRSTKLAQSILLERQFLDETQGAPGLDMAISRRLMNRSARRARQCLLFVGEHPGASNREIASGTGVEHESQISRLLSHLLAEGLVSKRSEGLGRRNAWELTVCGEKMMHALTKTEQ